MACVAPPVVSLASEQRGGAAASTAAAAIWESASVSKVKHDDGSKTINGFHIRQDLGEGSFAKVKLCEEERTGEQFALKIFRKGRLRRQRDFIGGSDGGGMRVSTSLDKVRNEVEIMRRLSHPNCIGLVALFDEPDQDGKLYLVLEYAARGCLMDWDPRRRSYFLAGTSDVLPEARARAFTKDVLQGLAYLHGAAVRIAHRDVKPQNLLLASNGSVKIGDFGVAIELGEDFAVQGTEGTYHFFSPEMCRSGYKGHDGRLADVWAAGVTLWAFVFGTVPFFCEDLLKLLESIAEAKYELPQTHNLSSAGRAFLLRALAPEPSDRPLCPVLLHEDPWWEASL